MSESKTVLIVDDERDLLELVSYNLRRTGYEVLSATNGRKALDLIVETKPDLVLLDLMLPELGGTEIASRVRANPLTATIPIIMLTAKGSETDQVLGLAVGADDYIAKPFSMKVLLARVEAILRRTSRAASDHAQLSLEAVRLDLETHEAFVHDELIKLTVTEFRILAALIQAKGRVLSRAALMNKAIGPGITVTERTIDVHVTAIRKKLGDQADLIKTVRGVGYRATPEPGNGDE